LHALATLRRLPFVITAIFTGKLSFYDLWKKHYHQLDESLQLSSACSWSVGFESPFTYTYGEALLQIVRCGDRMVEPDQRWTQAYLNLQGQWKLKPSWKLIEYLHLIPQGPVLDLGAGDERNALFFAALGHEVDYVDISKTYSKRMKDRANVENLELTAHNMDIRDFDLPEKHYALIIASKILQLFPKADIEDITRKMNLLAKSIIDNRL